MFAVPEICIADNGVQFGRSREFQEFLENYGVQPYYNALYTPQNNPTLTTMKTLIMSYIEEDERYWDLELSKVACALRTAKIEATRKTPYFVNFGFEMIDDGRQYALQRNRMFLTDSEDSEDDEDGNRYFNRKEIAKCMEEGKALLRS